MRRLWRAVSPARAPGEPWFLAGLRVGILGSVVLLLVAWVAAMADIETGAQALLLGVILLVPGLWLARRGRPGALAGQLGEVLAGVGLVLATGGALFLDTDRGLDRIALLEAIDELGSISAAAGRLGLSYRGAWDAVQTLNNLFEGPLVEAQPGGRDGGAAKVTPRGKAAVAAFRRVQGEVDAAMAK